MQNRINTKVVRAIRHLAAKNDVRSYLNGVYVEFQRDKTIYVASNGKALGKYTDHVDNMSEFSIIIPEYVAKQLKNPGDVMYDRITFNPDTSVARVFGHEAGQDFGFIKIDCEYTDFSKVIPSSTSGETAQFDVNLLSLFAKVNKGLGAKKPGCIRINHNGNAAALVDLSDSAFIGAVMPHNSKREESK
jgi:DNA polymerase III sliding clamp (beta) subunit (PCNA family)